jgi:hypothetical protein
MRLATIFASVPGHLNEGFVWQTAAELGAPLKLLDCLHQQQQQR